MLTQNDLEPRKLRIIIVEDEGLIARDIASTLDQLGYEVAGQAASGAEALQLARRVRADLVLMDIKLRGKQDGIETASIVREETGMPVVFLTSHADSETIRRANQTEPFGYIVKPFNEADLKVGIEVGLNHHSLQQQVEEDRTWFDTALESISGAVIAVDEEGRIRFFNESAEKLTGWTSGSARQHSLDEVVQLRDEKGQSQKIDLDSAMAADQPLIIGKSICANQSGSESIVTGSIGPMRCKGSGLLYGAVLTLQTTLQPVNTMPPYSAAWKNAIRLFLRGEAGGRGLAWTV